MRASATWRRATGCCSQMASDAVLIVDGASRSVLDSNPTARRLFGEAAEPAAPPAGAADVRRRHAHARSSSCCPACWRRDAPTTCTPGSPTAIARSSCSASLFRDDGGARLPGPHRAPHADPPATAVPKLKSKLLKLMESAPDGFVVTGDGRTDHHRQRRVPRTGAAADRGAGTRPIARPLAGPLRRRSRHPAGQSAPARLGPAVRHDAARRVGRAGRGRDLRRNGDERRRSRASDSPSATSAGGCGRESGERGRELPRSLEHLTELVGRVSLKDLVREATDVIERLCIEAALELTGDNRASAAEMLGLQPAEPLRQAAPLRPGRSRAGRRSELR